MYSSLYKLYFRSILLALHGYLISIWATKLLMFGESAFEFIPYGCGNTVLKLICECSERFGFDSTHTKKGAAHVFALHSLHVAALLCALVSDAVCLSYSTLPPCDRTAALQTGDTVGHLPLCRWELVCLMMRHLFTEHSAVCVTLSHCVTIRNGSRKKLLMNCVLFGL